jgi:hypothetical protein
MLRKSGRGLHLTGAVGQDARRSHVAPGIPPAPAPYGWPTSRTVPGTPVLPVLSPAFLSIRLASP